MAQKVLKSKSLTPALTDVNVETGCFTTRFMSFEGAIRLYMETYNITEKEVGYRITEQGIEICY